MTYFAIICSINTISNKFGGIRGINHLHYKQGEGQADVRYVGAGHSNNCKIILKLFRYDIFCNNFSTKTISSKFGGIGGITRSLTLQIGGRLQ